MYAEQRARQALQTAQHNIIARLAAAIRPLSVFSREQGYPSATIPAYDSLFRLKSAFDPVLDTPRGTTQAHAVGQIEGVLMSARVMPVHSSVEEIAVIDALEMAKNTMFSQTPGEIDQYTSEDLPDLEARLSALVKALPPKFALNEDAARKLMKDTLDASGIYEAPKA